MFNVAVCDDNIEEGQNILSIVKQILFDRNIDLQMTISECCSTRLKSYPKRKCESAREIMPIPSTCKTEKNFIKRLVKNIKYDTIKQTKRHKLCFGIDKGKTFQNRINTGKNSGDSKTVTLVQKKAGTVSRSCFNWLKAKKSVRINR